MVVLSLCTGLHADWWRAIVGEKLAGFPKQDELKSVFVDMRLSAQYVDHPCIRKDFALHGCACLFAYVDYPCLRKDFALHGACFCS